MGRSLRTLLALGAFFVVVVALAACGGKSVPGNAVARVGDDLITKTTFDHWLRIAALSSQPPGSTTQAVVPDPPRFTRCIAAKRASAPKPPKGQKPPTDTALRTQCRQEYQGVRDQVLNFLISAQWVSGEAKERGIKVTDAEVQRQFQQVKRQQYPKEKDFQRFLAQSGQTVSDLLFRLRVSQLSNKLRDSVTKGKDKVTDKEIAAYYNSHKRQFAQPERRDLLVVLTKTKSRAQAARRALQSGQSFKKVAKKYSIDPASKSRGGKLPNVTKGQQDKALDDAVFAATKGKLTGPVKSSFGYYVFEVTKITPPSQQTLAQTRTTIRSLLSSQNQQKALQSFVDDWQKKWKSQTTCRKGYVVPECDNAPKPKKTTEAPPGAVPQQGGGQVPVPQQGGGGEVPVPQQGGGGQPPSGQAPPPPGG